ncbi:O-antigen ligase family protein [Leptolyngbya iicbica LK]|uniref:O-antigen ligase family protein n=2 Tax=Cyanophyceae TaxID=3028117 RepID=A0A4Q7EGJ5_9CYAN|nr:O-antigen ligase family protein [Leptolyngbya sp. LK]
MAHTDAQSHWLMQGIPRWHQVLPICLGLLSYPYSMFVGLLGLLSLSIWQTLRSPKAIFFTLFNSGLIAIAVLMVISSSQAVYPGEAYLQLAHFLPFFWLWACLTVYLQQTLHPWAQIYRWTVVLVLAAVPINLVGIVEYLLKLAPNPALLPYFPLIDWLYLGDTDILRAYSLFDYPNTLASYLTLILGLNLGLVFLEGQETPWGRQSTLSLWLIRANVLLTLGCLFASGSRNGLLAAIALIVVSLLRMRTNRWVRLLGLAGLALIVVTTLSFGVAGRSVSWSWVTDDPRIQVWRLAWQMFLDEPILGQGLGNYKLLYNGEIPLYTYIAHAHNFWLTLAAEAGLIVTVLFTLAIGLICYRGCRALMSLKPAVSHHALLMGYCLAFLGIALFSLLDITYFEARVNAVTWLSLSVIAASPVLSQKINH